MKIDRNIVFKVRNYLRKCYFLKCSEINDDVIYQVKYIVFHKKDRSNASKLVITAGEKKPFFLFCVSPPNRLSAALIIDCLERIKNTPTYFYLSEGNSVEWINLEYIAIDPNFVKEVEIERILNKQIIGETVKSSLKVSDMIKLFNF